MKYFSLFLTMLILKNLIMLHIFILIALNSSLLESKLVGGSAVSDIQKKYMASIQLIKKSISNPELLFWNHVCSAGAIAPKFLLSSARCVNDINSIILISKKYASAVVGTDDLMDERNRHYIQNAFHHTSFKIESQRETSDYNYGVILVY